jgi:hypothetical protein
MSSQPRLQGVFSPVLTPFNADLSPDPDRFVRHCRWLIEQDVGLAVAFLCGPGGRYITGATLPASVTGNTLNGNGIGGSLLEK